MLSLPMDGAPDFTPLCPGEDPDTKDPAEAGRWVRIFSELVALHEERLQRAGGRRAAGDARTLLDDLRVRLEFWRQRHLEMAGLDLDTYARVLSAGGRTIQLTKREVQLLDYLLERPGQHFTSEALIREAWQDPRLAPEQVRTYVVRVRRKLEESGVPARIVNQQRLGYALIIERDGRGGSRGRAS